MSNDVAARYAAIEYPQNKGVTVPESHDQHAYVTCIPDEGILEMREELMQIVKETDCVIYYVGESYSSFIFSIPSGGKNPLLHVINKDDEDVTMVERKFSHTVSSS